MGAKEEAFILRSAHWVSHVIPHSLRHLLQTVVGEKKTKQCFSLPLITAVYGSFFSRAVFVWESVTVANLRRVMETG